MTERKVLNKYYPPDFDPRKLPKLKLPRNRQYVIRTMAPFNMQCKTCGEYIYKGKKFNARKETVEDEKYLELEIYRFYIRCPRCLAEITFKTDLENCDYKEEHGSTRLFEAEKLVREMEKQVTVEEEKEKSDPMKMLEKRTKMSRFEMDALARLEELRELNARQAKQDLINTMLSKINAENEKQLKQQEEDDEAFVKRYFADEDGVKVKRLLDEDDDDNENLFRDASASTSGEYDVRVKREAEDYECRTVFDDAVDKRVEQVKSIDSIPKEKAMKADNKISSISKQKELLKNVVKVKKSSKSSEERPILKVSSGSGVETSSTDLKNTKSSTFAMAESSKSLSLIGSYSSSSEDDD